jgi:hypothetical protein
VPMKIAMTKTNSTKRTPPNWRSIDESLRRASASVSIMSQPEKDALLGRALKNPHAKALGALGGSANTPAQKKARAAQASAAAKARWKKSKKKNT